MNKRAFLKNTALLGLGSLVSLGSQAKTADGYTDPLADNGSDEDFWASVRKQYDLNQDFINLENGFYCIMPHPIREKYFDHIRYTNLEGAHYMRTIKDENKQKAAAKLAKMMGCHDDEMIITRNTTESLDLIISGFHWETGDEAIMA